MIFSDENGNELQNTASVPYDIQNDIIQNDDNTNNNDIIQNDDITNNNDIAHGDDIAQNDDVVHNDDLTHNNDAAYDMLQTTVEDNDINVKDIIYDGATGDTVQGGR